MLQNLLEELQIYEGNLKILEEFYKLWDYNYLCELENSLHYSKNDLDNKCQNIWDKYDKPKSITKISKEDIEDFLKVYNNYYSILNELTSYKTKIDEYIEIINLNEYNSVYRRTETILSNIDKTKKKIEHLKSKIILEKSKLFDELIEICS